MVSALLTGLPAAIPPDARLLILGSMPGAESLRRGEYYAHPRNQFWDIIEAAYAIPRALPYEERLARLGHCGVALWDVAARCRRPGSLDAAIDPASVVPNDLAALFATHPALAVVCFNGQKAAALYRKLVLPRLGHEPDRPAYYTLPSTSPAHAALTAAEKRRRWLAVLKPETGSNANRDTATDLKSVPKPKPSKGDRSKGDRFNNLSPNPKPNPSPKKQTRS